MNIIPWHKCRVDIEWSLNQVLEVEPRVTLIESAIASAIGQQRYELWFRAHVRFEITRLDITKPENNQEAVIVKVRSAHLLDWLTTTFQNDIRKAVEQTIGTTEIRFTADPSAFALNNRLANTELAPSTNANTSATTNNRKPALNLFGEVIPQVEQKPVRRENDQAKLTRRFRSLRDFIVGACNRVAFAACQAVIEEPGQTGNPIVIHGPVGVGKTHLLEGVYAGIRRRDLGERPIFITAEEFTSRAVQSMRFGKMTAFRSRFREASALIIDDLHFLAKKTATQEEFLYTFDALVSDGRPVVVSMDCHPRLADELMPELVDRLLGGVSWSLMPPDDETRLALLRSKAMTSGPLAFSEEVLTFLARNLKGNVRELEGAVAAIRHYARVTNRPIDLSVAREAAGDLLRHAIRTVTIDDIESAVYRVLNLPKGTLQSSSKAWAVTHPRMAAIYLARKHTAATYGEIAKKFGIKQHSSAVAAEKRVRNWLTRGDMINVGGQEWPAADLLARIERELSK